MMQRKRKVTLTPPREKNGCLSVKLESPSSFATWGVSGQGRRGKYVCVRVCVFMYVHVLPFGDRGWMRVQKCPVVFEFYSAINLVTKVDQSPGSEWCFFPCMEGDNTARQWHEWFARMPYGLTWKGQSGHSEWLTNWCWKDLLNYLSWKLFSSLSNDVL